MAWSSAPGCRVWSPPSLQVVGQSPNFSSSWGGSRRMMISPTWFSSVQFSHSVMSDSCLTLCNPVDCSTPGLPVHHQLQRSLKLKSIESVMPSNHLILCRPLLLLPSIFSSIKVFSNKLVLRIRKPKYWSFSFSISPSNEYSGLISYRMDWLDLCSPRDSQESSPTPQFKSINSFALSFLHSPTLTSIHDY